MTLTEFLLARIADDEMVAREGTDQKGVPPYCSEIFPNLGEYGLTVYYETSRVLAECAAKRRIIERIDGHLAEWTVTLKDAPPDRLAEALSHEAIAYRRAMWWTLECLASVYADHPDYPQEWVAYAAKA